MITIVYSIMLLLVILVIVKCLININELNKQIDKILVEEKRQNERIDMLEKREQIRQLKQRRDKVCNDAKDLFEEW